MSSDDKPKVRDLYVVGPSGREVRIQRIEPNGKYLVPGYGQSGFDTQEEAVRVAEERLPPRH
jgi:hypothetical protein